MGPTTSRSLNVPTNVLKGYEQIMQMCPDKVGRDGQHWMLFQKSTIKIRVVSRDIDSLADKFMAKLKVTQ